MGVWKRGKVAPDGVCHICKAPADGPYRFETRFCFECLAKGFELDESRALNSKYAIILFLHRIQMSYKDVVNDIEVAINSLLKGKPVKPGSLRGPLLNNKGKLKNQGLN